MGDYDKDRHKKSERPYDQYFCDTPLSDDVGWWLVTAFTCPVRRRNAAIIVLINWPTFYCVPLFRL